MEKAIAQFKLEDGTEVLFEVPKPQRSGGSALEEVGIADQIMHPATQTFEKAIDKVKPVANAVISRLRDGLTAPADEVEVTFGITLNADSGVIFSSVGGEVSFEITLRWAKD